MTMHEEGREMIFDVWEFPQKCEGCGRFDNHDESEPICYLDINTKLCEFCFAEKEENQNE